MNFDQDNDTNPAVNPEQNSASNIVPDQPSIQSQQFTEPPQPQPGFVSQPNPTPPQANGPQLSNPANVPEPVSAPQGVYPGAPVENVVNQPTPPIQGATLSPTPVNKKSKKRRLVIVVGVVVLFLALLATYIFAIYLPSRPRNVWNTGLNRSKQAINTIVDKGTQKQAIGAFKKSEITVEATGKVDEVSYDGKFNTKYDATNSVGSLKVSTKQDGEADKSFSAKYISQAQKDTLFPNIYLQFAGLKSFGLDSYLPSLNSFENKWIAVDASYFESLGVTADEVKASQKNQLTSDDISELTRVIVEVSSDYMFSTDSQKAVFEQRKFVGKENVDGKSTYHYVVGINKSNANKYCAEVVEKVVQTAAYKKLATGTDASQKDSIVKDCQQEANDSIKDSTTFDLWIDAKYKLVYKVRVTDEKDKSIYVDFGQNYLGGDDVSFFINSYDGTAKSDVKFKMSTNLKTYISKATLTMTTKSSPAYDITLTIDAKPYSGQINADKPANTISIEKVIEAVDAELNNTIAD